MSEELHREPRRRYFVISDTHLNHRMLIEKKFRPPDFEELLVNNWRTMVNDKDVVIHTGDVAVGGDVRAAHELMTSLPGKKNLVRGNHDSKSIGWYLNRGWDWVCDAFDMSYRGQMLRFSHRPIDPADLGSVDLNIHGHLHNLPESSHRGEEVLHFYGKKHLLVSVERTKYQPVVLDRILDLHNKRSWA